MCHGFFFSTEALTSRYEPSGDQCGEGSNEGLVSWMCRVDSKAEFTGLSFGNSLLHLNTAFDFEKHAMQHREYSILQIRGYYSTMFLSRCRSLAGCGSWEEIDWWSVTGVQQG